MLKMIFNIYIYIYIYSIQFKIFRDDLTTTQQKMVCPFVPSHGRQIS